MYLKQKWTAGTLALVFACEMALAQEARELEYSWLTDERITGHQVATYDSDGTIRIRFAYSDRGRGPDFESTLKLNHAGIPTQFQATGSNNTRAAIDEQFAVEDNTATWRSSVESGNRTVTGNEFYRPYNESPEILAILARALLNDSDQGLALLPAGQASIEKVSSVDVELDGETQSIAIYGISGLDAEPAYVWLDENNDLFGLTRQHFAIVRKGWESSLATLKGAEFQEKERFFRSISDSLTHELPDLTVITGARVFDSTSGELTEPATVFIWNGSISAVYFDEVGLPEDAAIIDASGKTLMPTLWDMHNHVNPQNLLNHLAAGVTNVREMGSIHDDIQQLIGKIDDGSFAGPDIHPLGFIDKRGEFAAPVGKFADTLDDALSIVDFYARRGYRGIKLYSSIEPGWVSPIAIAAHERGLSVAGHVPAFMTAEQAIRSGYDEVTHVNMLLLNFLGGQDLDTRGPERFLVPGRMASELDIESEEVQEFISLMREKQIAHDTTLAVIVEMFRNRPGELSPIFSGVADHLPGYARRKLIMTEGYNQGLEDEFAQSIHFVFDLVAELHRSGIRLLPGTDNFLPGFTLIRELIYYTEAGIPPNEVLQIGTIEAARHMGLDHRLGSISVGKDAHLYVIDGDPVEDINDLYRVEHVIKGRKMYFAPDVLRAQEFVPFRH